MRAAHCEIRPGENVTLPSPTTKSLPLAPAGTASNFAWSGKKNGNALMKLSAAHQPSCYVGRLQQRALGREMGSQIPRDSKRRRRWDELPVKGRLTV
jgi:hypothetical protein